MVKASERTAWSSSYFISIVRAALSACGHSSQLVHSIVCWPRTADHLTSHPDIRHITFIGSRPVAHSVCSSAARALIPVCVELGGKDPCIVLDDVQDLDKVANILIRGSFQAAGQNCVGIERIIALPTAYARLIRILRPRVRDLRIGSILEGEAVDIGAMISDMSFSRIEGLIMEAVAQGAKLLCGGSQYVHPSHPKGHYFSPTLLIDVLPTMRIAQEEVFGPVCVLMRASTIADAIKIANSTPYALGSSVFGTSTSDLETITHNIKAGMVSVNDFAVYYAVQLPFGGVDGSGYGRFAGKEGLRSICNMKSVCRDRFPRLLSTSIPAPLNYPIKDMITGWEFCKGVIELGYREDLFGKCKAIWKIMVNS